MLESQLNEKDQNVVIGVEGSLERCARQVAVCPCCGSDMKLEERVWKCDERECKFVMSDFLLLLMAERSAYPIFKRGLMRTLVFIPVKRSDS